MSNPALFVSHGPPSIPLDEVPARRFLEGLGTRLERPSAILAVSAHWMTDRPALTAAAQPGTIHDFFGFPDALYRMTYAAPGAPDLAARAQVLLEAAGFEADLDSSRGLDHGTWTPLRLIFPDADIPVIQLSIQPDQSPEHHIALGAAIAPLRNDGILVVGSGNTTHNLGAWRAHRHLPDGEAPDWVTGFADWVRDRVEACDADGLASYGNVPHGLDNHPSPDHFLPLFTALGTGGGTGRVLHKSVSYGVLAMDAYAFE